MVPEPLLSAAGVLAVLIAMVVDGASAVMVASVAVAAGLAPTLAETNGAGAVAVLFVAAAAAVLAGAAGRRLGRRLPWVAGLDPQVPAVAAGQRLFGPRSVRVWASGLGIPAASWVSFNVPIGAVTTVTGLLFPVAYAWVCGALRMLVARTLEDLAVGTAMVGMATSAAWLLRGGPETTPEAAVLAALAPAAAAVAGWLGGRHARRPAEQAS